ncbi:DNA/RNA non-specific endonuclease [Lactococcus lactis]|uniref:DNA/RNA non-specific endonuclease n=1 Tax=Lactococcus lactis TaxID=1358 RepID=UPI002891E7AE|nr:DNA/RNA non-specific endonuclease [Lactococcus lactis]MDT2909279.1 DNA/RNA non-specific endonuclease [Lactococcus lactis]MDT2925191.1 DNA/RNA non-specific endonuclease [Lactococcus lactis]MDT2952050.1 DNA/RNA non-specific endonuclease [Lactococcus lactis]
MLERRKKSDRLTTKQENLSTKFFRRVISFILATVIMIFIWSVVVSNGIFINGKINTNNLSRFGNQIFLVANNKAPISTLIPTTYEMPGGTSVYNKLNPSLKEPKDTELTQKTGKFTTLKMNGHFQFIMSPKDKLGRAVSSHIQLKYSDMEKIKGSERPPKINYNPVGWHNYKFSYRQGETTGVAWLMQRGHMVGYQFCGVNDDGRNLFPETAWTNAGSYDSMDDSNQQSQLYYENLLRNWLKKHGDDWLDYEVKPLYRGDNLVPDRVKLTFIGLTQDGKTESINISSSYGKRLDDGAEEVILSNSSPNAVINYENGEAIER